MTGGKSGRSVWNDGIPIFAQRGAAGLAQWLEREALPNFHRLARVVDVHAAAVLLGHQPDEEPSHA